MLPTEAISGQFSTSPASQKSSLGFSASVELIGQRAWKSLDEFIKLPDCSAFGSSDGSRTLAGNVQFSECSYSNSKEYNF